jgi:hypothetical protein
VNADGIRILSIYPGRTATPMIKALCEFTEWPYEPELLLQPEDISQIIVDTLRLPRTAENHQSRDTAGDQILLTTHCLTRHAGRYDGPPFSGNSQTLP